MPVTFRAVIPRTYNFTALQNQTRQAANEVGRGMKSDFEKSVQGWSTDIKFSITTEVTSSVVRIIVGTSDDVYVYVSKGTKAHPIRATKAPALRFQTGYKAATRPGSLSSQSPRRSGDVVYARQVQHPGTKARKFDEQVAKRWERKAARIFLKAFERGLIVT